MMKPLQKPLVHKAVKESHLLRGIFQHISDNILEHPLRQKHIVLQVGKGNLRLDHPELRRVAGRVGIFRAERGAKGVDLFKSHGIRLAV